MIMDQMGEGSAQASAIHGYDPMQMLRSGSDAPEQGLPQERTTSQAAELRPFPDTISSQLSCQETEPDVLPDNIHKASSNPSESEASPKRLSDVDPEVVNEAAAANTPALSSVV